MLGGKEWRLEILWHRLSSPVHKGTNINEDFRSWSSFFLLIKTLLPPPFSSIQILSFLTPVEQQIVELLVSWTSLSFCFWTKISKFSILKFRHLSVCSSPALPVEVVLPTPTNLFSFFWRKRKNQREIKIKIK